MKNNRLLKWSGSHIAQSIGIILMLIVVVASIMAPILAPYDPTDQDLRLGLSNPSWQHPMGTDQLGRDILSRLLWAGRISILSAITVLSFSLLIGAILGMLAGYLGGMVDNIIMRVVDVFLSLPTFILALAFIGALGPGMRNLVIALVIAWWPSYARLVRSKVLAIKSSEYVTAAQTLGASNLHIILRHFLPSLVGPVLVVVTLDVGHVMLSIAGLGFLGLGVQPPSPEWGTMLVDARPFLQYALHMVIPPGLMILFMVFGFHALSEVLDELLNPAQKDSKPAIIKPVVPEGCIDENETKTHLASDGVNT